MNELFCEHCGKNVEYETETAGKHLKAICSECRMYIKFLPQGGDDILYFGKYKGRKIEEIAKEDREYLEWLLENIEKRNLKTKIEKYL